MLEYRKVTRLGIEPRPSGHIPDALTFQEFKRFKAYAENATGKKIKRFRDDKGGEYMSKEFQNFMDECGIARHTCRNRP